MSAIDALLEKGRKQHEQAKPEQALAVFNQALFLAHKEGNHERLVQVFADRVNAFRQLYERDSDPLFAVLARKDAETVFELVKLWAIGERLHTAYYLLGQAAMLFQEYAEAENYFFKALRYFKGSPTEKGSWRYHHAKALYLMGEKKRALLAFAKAIDEIRKNKGGPDQYLTDVYLSGAYLSFAEVLAKDDPTSCHRYLDMARQLIHSDKKLVIRSKQLKTLEKRISSDSLEP